MERITGARREEERNIALRRAQSIDPKLDFTFIPKMIYQVVNLKIP